MIQTASIDISGLNQMIQGLQWAFIGAGRDGDAANIVADESSKLALECAARVSAKDLNKAQRKVNSDVRKFFLPGPAHDAFTGNQRGGSFGHTWLYAGPNFLAGAFTEDVQPGISMSAMRSAMRQPSRASNAWLPLGKRGKQNVVRMNRIVTTRGKLDALKSLLDSRLGRMKATFARSGQEIAASIGKKVRVTAWISRHFSDGNLAGGYKIGSQPDKPFVEFSSRAPGVDKQEAKIAGVVKSREAKVRKRIDLVLFGYANDVNRGATPKRHAPEDNEDYNLFFGSE